MMLQSQPVNSTVPAGLAHHSKRKATDALDNNERLSKRLSLLNIEQGGARLYAPIVSTRLPASPQITPSTSSTSSSTISSYEPLHGQYQPALPVAARRSPARTVSVPPAAPAVPAVPAVAAAPPIATASVSPDESCMQVDDTKYKVYIYNIDDELASDPESEGEGEGDNAGTTAGANGKLVFLSDVDKHLRDAARSNAGFVPAIPRPVRPNEDGELAGMQLVLYNDPSSLSVPREHDSVRQAILEARARIRERQRERHEHERDQEDQSGLDVPDVPDMTDGEPPATPQSPAQIDDDSDAMEMD